MAYQSTLDDPVRDTNAFYRRTLHVDFIARLREERWFPDMDQLVEHMKQDAALAREILSR